MLIDVAFYRLVCKLHDSHLIKALESALSKPITGGFIKAYHWWIYRSLSLVDLSKSITGGFIKVYHWWIYQSLSLVDLAFYRLV